MPRGVKTDNKKIAEIMTSYALTNSYNKTAKEVGVSDSTVKKIILAHQEEFTKVREVKKELFQDKANRIIDKSLELIESRIDIARLNQNELEEIISMIWSEDKDVLNEVQKRSIVSKISKMQLNSLSELTTALGTLYDKMRLAKGEPTGNEQKFEFVLKVEE